MNEQQRETTIIRTSAVGIASNLVLAAMKAVVGLMTNSIAILLDAVNNFSDVLSSVVTIIGTKLAGKKPDKKHPLGYGRIEYITAMVVTAIVLYAGITAGVESIKKIFHPVETEYSVISLILVAAAIVVKILLGMYTSSVGKKVNSAALSASGADATFDAVLSGATLACALLAKFTGISLEAVVGVIIAIVIIKAGMEMLLETTDEMLGKRPEPDLLDAIRATLTEDEEVFGAYDLILHSYGPERIVGSVHVEVADTMTADAIDMMGRRLSETVYREHGVMLTGISIYSMSSGEEARALRSGLSKRIMAHKGILQMHGFHLNEAEKTVSLDIVIDYDCKDREALYEAVCQEIREAYPDYTFRIVQDIDVL
ncbi:MAG: cation diffusion facilitator family transporter [Oscillospiraceae bacterium]|nr:cation diffusion facilitator family transporter [Oscillospiraceae bacterium]